MHSRRIHIFRALGLGLALAACNFALNGEADAALADFLFLTPKGVSEGGGGNSYTGDIAAPSMYEWNPVAFHGTIVDSEPVIAEAMAVALEFSTELARLRPDVTFSAEPPPAWHTVKSGLNVLNVLDYPEMWCILPQTIFGDEGDTVVVNVMHTGDVQVGIQVGGALRPENLIVNILNASMPYLGLGGRRTAGTYLVANGRAHYGAGGGGLDGAIISTSYIDIAGGANSFNHYPFDASAIPEPTTLLLLGLGSMAGLCKRWKK